MVDVMCAGKVRDPDTAGLWDRPRRSCMRRGVVEEDGRWWCRQHAPSHIRARYDAARVVIDAARTVAAEIARTFTLDAAAVRIDAAGESITLTIDAARSTPAPATHPGAPRGSLPWAGTLCHGYVFRPAGGVSAGRLRDTFPQVTLCGGGGIRTLGAHHPTVFKSVQGCSPGVARCQEAQPVRGSAGPWRRCCAVSRRIYVAVMSRPEISDIAY